MPSIGTIMAVIRKRLLRPRTLIIRTRTNQNISPCTKLYRRIIPQTRKNKKKASSTKLYCRTILRTWKNYVQQRQTNQNTHMCLILTSLTYFHAEETILTCHMKERTWLLKEMKTLRTFLTLWTNVRIVTAKDCSVKISKKLFSASWNNNKKKSNVA